MQDGLIDEQAFSFESDEAEAQFYESVEREIEQTLAEGLPPIEEDEAERRIRAVIARFANANVGESR